MPMDGLTLRFLARELSEKLVGGRVDKISQPERDELLITIRNNGINHTLLLTASAGYARAHLTQFRRSNPLEPPRFCMLLRKLLPGGRVLSIQQIGTDRILFIKIQRADELGDPARYTLACEFMGKHSNIILLNGEGRILDAVRRISEQISRVREVLPGLAYEYPPTQNKLSFDEINEMAVVNRFALSNGFTWKALAAQIAGLSRQTAQEIALLTTGDSMSRLEDQPMPAFAQRLCEFFHTLDERYRPAIVFADGGDPLDVTAFPYRLYQEFQHETTDSLSAAMDCFYHARDQHERISQKSAALRRVLRNNIERCEKKLALQEEALASAAKMEEYRLYGEMLNAGLGSIRKGAKYAELVNYYDPELKTLKIPLDEKLTPTQNAQKWFKRYQKARSARDLAREQKEKTLAELAYLETQAYNLDACDTEAELNEIREELEKQGLVGANHNRSRMKKLPPSRPRRYRSSTGIDIYVGKNNLQNERLTQSAPSGAIWLHAKDIPGSHVLIPAGTADEATLFEAALLAAKYSKSGSGSQVPVDYTLRKYVKKPSGSRPGFVIYTHQRTMFVTPDEDALRRVLPISEEPS